MIDPSADIGDAVHLALHTRLDGAVSGQDGVACPLYDSVPDGARPPYVTYDTTDIVRSDLLTDLRSGVLFGLTAWSDRRGRTEVLSILAQIRGLTHRAPLPLATGHLVEMTVTVERVVPQIRVGLFQGQILLRAMVAH